ncbi:MAG: hypothetical protein RLY31_3023 [Bacteroidota bacterium]
MRVAAQTYDFVVVGSGFGGSVAALRLSEKGYKVLVLEQGRWFRRPEDFPRSNWQLRRWIWLPWLGMKGIFRMTFFRHVAVLSGAGVGGGSLVYANTLPVPSAPFFRSGTWKDLCDWERELAPFYDLAKRMLGVTPHPYRSKSDEVMRSLAEDIGAGAAFRPAEVAVYFGRPGETVSDPYFGGLGPDRTGCNQCGGCMLGCRYNAKNTLDKNYLHLAQRLGCEIRAETTVHDIIPVGTDGGAGYIVRARKSGLVPRQETIRAGGVVVAAGVLGTLRLLLRLQRTSLPKLSHTLGRGVRTNSESLVGVTSFDRRNSFSEGIAIGSIVRLDAHRHVEPVKYPAGSGFWRLFMAPMVEGRTFLARLVNMAADLIRHPVPNLRTFLVDDWSRRTHILLYMESLESTLRIKRSAWWGGLRSAVEKGKAPTAFNPPARDIARRVGRLIRGKPMVMFTETLFGIPTTAHILGGACMGAGPETGVIDRDNRVFHYQNLYICDGSMISANVGVNPSLTITALAERAMSRIPAKAAADVGEVGR